MVWQQPPSRQSNTNIRRDSEKWWWPTDTWRDEGLEDLNFMTDPRWKLDDRWSTTDSLLWMKLDFDWTNGITINLLRINLKRHFQIPAQQVVVFLLGVVKEISSKIPVFSHHKGNPDGFQDPSHVSQLNTDKSDNHWIHWQRRDLFNCDLKILAKPCDIVYFISNESNKYHKFIKVPLTKEIKCSVC